MLDFVADFSSDKLLHKPSGGAFGNQSSRRRRFRYTAYELLMNAHRYSFDSFVRFERLADNQLRANVAGAVVLEQEVHNHLHMLVRNTVTREVAKKARYTCGCGQHPRPSGWQPSDRELWKLYRALPEEQQLLQSGTSIMSLTKVQRHVVEPCLNDTKRTCLYYHWSRIDRPL